MPSPLSNLIAELKRRRVFRVAVVYAGVAFIIIQIIDGAFDYLPIPDWVGTAIIVLLLVGFPIAVALAWAFDITDKGVVRTAAEGEAESKAASRPLIGNKTLAIVAVMAVIAAVWSWWGRPAASVPDKSIAVLPFANFSDSKEDEYFSDGITEDIMAHLSKIGDLTVIGRTSVMQYKGTTKRLRDIGEELGVATLLEGSVRRAGGKVRIVSQLIDARTEKHLWAETYDREVDDAEIFALQSDVAQRIAASLKTELSSEESQRIEQKPTESREAYDHYLKGRYFWNKRTKEGLQKAVEYFEFAIETDSSYALAYAGLADCYNLLPFYAGWLPEESYPRAKAAALKALGLDNNLAEAHTSLAAVKFWNEWDWSTAEYEFKQAIQLNPGYATGRFWYGVFMANMRRFDEGIIELKRARELDPLSLILNANLGDIFYWARRYNEAIDQYRKTIEMDSEFLPSHWGLGLVYLQIGMFEEAIEEFKISGSAELAYAYVASGRRDDALTVLKGLEKRSIKERVDPILFAKVYLGLGEKERAFESLERAYEERSPWLVETVVFPYFDPLRDDPRFQDLLRRMNFPE